MSATGKHVLITGASGLIGRALREILTEKGYHIRTLTTQKNKANAKDIFYWNPEQNIIDVNALRSTDYIIHLTGAGIGDQRWNRSYKKSIKNSRIRSAELMYNNIKALQIPLKAFISASATGIYSYQASDYIINEDAPSGGHFLGSVCKEWENIADFFHLSGIRTVKLRTGVVLDKSAPALQKILAPVKAGFACPLGTGKQYVPWISLTDLCNIYVEALENEKYSGAYNAVAPQHITNKEMMQIFAEKLHKPFINIPVPEFLLRMILGERSVILTKGNQVIPARLTKAGFKFQDTDIRNIEL